ncbi:MAG: hypothetical protein ACOCRX_12275 [Candidatus Woesearchaeota archaeon]
MSFREERKKLKNKIKGGSKKNFRSLKKWNVENKILYGIMYSHNLPVSDLAEIIGVSPRSVQAWLFEGRMPKEKSRKKICELFDYPEDIIFYDIIKSGWEE